MISTIYEPKGKAREYSPLALNIYTSCNHGCKYCYAQKFFNGDVKVRKEIYSELRKKLDSIKDRGESITKQVLLSFTGDIYYKDSFLYGITRPVLELLNFYDVPVSILTKGGVRALVDLDIFRHFKRFQLGTTLTFDNDIDSKKWEPNAALPNDRIDMLRIASENGIRTFVSFEPVVIPEQTLHLMELAMPYTHHYKIGKWNHDKRANDINWKEFGVKAMELCNKYNKPFYIKNDLAREVDGVNIKPENRNPELFEI